MDALWQRLEYAATAHKEEVQQLQQQLQDASNVHEEEEKELRQMAADAAAAHQQEVQRHEEEEQDLQQRLAEASVDHRHQVENLQQQHEEDLALAREQHKAALSQVRVWGRGVHRAAIVSRPQITSLAHKYTVNLNDAMVSGHA